jgi:biopolymer transport protein ExbD
MKLDDRIKRDSSIPTSSMADIAFLLIIFFMVTSVFSATKGLEFQMPADDGLPPDSEPEEAVFVHVRVDDVLVDCRPMELDQILPYLEPRLTRNPNKPVILYTDPGAEYGNMIEVYDVLSAGENEPGKLPFAVKNISVPTKKEIEDYIELFGENPLETRCQD